MMAAPGFGMLSLIDNREVSPAPVSHFKPKTLGNNIGNNRVSLPFNRSGSFKETSTLDKLTSGSRSGVEEAKGPRNFKLSSSNESKLQISIQ